MEHRLNYVMNDQEMKFESKRYMEYYNDVYNKCLLLSDEKKQYLTKPCSYYLEKYESYRTIYGYLVDKCKKNKT